MTTLGATVKVPELDYPLVVAQRLLSLRTGAGRCGQKTLLLETDGVTWLRRHPAEMQFAVVPRSRGTRKVRRRPTGRRCVGSGFSTGQQGACDNQPAKTPFRFQIAKAARTQARTWVQSCSLRWPITVNSER